MSFPKGCAVLHPNENSLVKHFAAHQEEYQKLMHLLPDFIRLSEFISYAGFTLYSGVYGIRKNDENLENMSGQVRDKNTLTIDAKGSSLKQDWSYFVLSSFRHLLEKDSKGNYVWKVSFDKVLAFAKASLPKIIEKIRKRKKELRTFGMYAKVTKKINTKTSKIADVDRWLETFKDNKKLFKEWKNELESNAVSLQESLGVKIPLEEKNMHIFDNTHGNHISTEDQPLL